jgi:proteasome accessory factor A
VLFQRLAGLETEYALRLPKRRDELSRFTLYQKVIARIGLRVLSVEAQHFKEGVFTANGGAIWFDAERPAAGAGVLEGATPECRDPATLLLYQRAQDQLLGEAAAATPNPFFLIKNDRDSEDNIYGAQENYECVIGSRWQMALWRAGMVLLIPAILLWWLGFGLSFMALLAYQLAAALLFVPLQFVVRSPQQLAYNLFGRDVVEGRETGSPTPVWIEHLFVTLSRVMTAPLAVGLWLVAKLVLFRRVRRHLTPFLISRSVIGGAGTIDSSGKFWLSDKAPAINCANGIGGFFKERPIFILGHFLKTLRAESCSDYSELFAPKQRLQIGIGDSNMAEVAEFLRIGTTMLVLDAIENGEIVESPTFANPISALRTWCGDSTLTARATDTAGREWTALELQRFYCDVCRRMVDQQFDPPAAALEVVHRWEAALDDLEQLRDLGEPPQRLIGSLDWVTKKWLLDRAGDEATWSECKKIDIRYHELSEDGYYKQLESAGLTCRLIDEERIDVAIRTPPPQSPATTRGRYIREFAHGSEPLRVNWRSVAIGYGFRTKVIRLSQYSGGLAVDPRIGSAAPSDDETEGFE